MPIGEPALESERALEDEIARRGERSGDSRRYRDVRNDQRESETDDGKWTVEAEEESRAMV